MSLFQVEKARTWVADLRVNQSVDDVFLVTEKSMRSSRSGNPFLALELADRTGRIQARVWENAQALAAAAVVDRYVRVAGQVAEFNDSLQINVTAMELVPDEDVDQADFLPATTRDLGEMLAELRSSVERISSPPLRALAESFFFSETGILEPFQRAPAAMMIHHAVVGGLLEHTLSVAGLCLDLARRFPFLSADLLLTAALLHDVGKVRELSWSRRFDYTDEGRLVGHLVIGAEMVTERARAIEGFPEETLLLLRHMILSHHGKYEWGSPKRPKTMEALALHYADDLDCKLCSFKDYLRAEDEKEPEARWTSYHRGFERHLYKGAHRFDDRTQGGR